MSDCSLWFLHQVRRGRTMNHPVEIRGPPWTLLTLLRLEKVTHPISLPGRLAKVRMHTALVVHVIVEDADIATAWMASAKHECTIGKLQGYHYHSKLLNNSVLTFTDHICYWYLCTQRWNGCVHSKRRHGLG